MSIAVRLWSDAELRAVKRDKWLATLLMNGTSFSAEEMAHYPYEQRRTYNCDFGDKDETTTIYATIVDC
ncbi:hypothetical protein LCGC14_1226500 [marine sediment metagenome]|uniref:Uncharacterized protein n=1 Tax=marine sediment metagenome TaxID=412755 RepID=A0A0F9LWX4_9ZZZZ